MPAPLSATPLLEKYSASASPTRLLPHCTNSRSHLTVETGVGRGGVKLMRLRGDVCEAVSSRCGKEMMYVEFTPIQRLGGAHQGRAADGSGGGCRGQFRTPCDAPFSTNHPRFLPSHASVIPDPSSSLPIHHL
ncbi:unnamed protein product, partial [Closterium sp. Naga37s-1]